MKNCGENTHRWKNEDQKNGNFIVYAIHMKWKYFSWMNLAEGNILLFPVHIQIVFQQTIVFISIQYYSITLCKVEYSTRF